MQGEFFTLQHYNKYSCREIQKDRHRVEILASFLRAFRFFPSIVTGALQALLGTRGEVRGGREARRRRKFIKYLKVRKRLLSPAAINFHLHFIFVSFVTAREWSGVRTNDGGGGGKKLQKGKGRRKVTEMPEGNIVERFDDGRRPLCALEKLSR